MAEIGQANFKPSQDMRQPQHPLDTEFRHSCSNRFCNRHSTHAAAQASQYPRKQKTALVLVFAIGFSTSITSIMRFNSLVRISSSRDLTFGNASKATWSAGETNIGIACASQPALHPVLARLLPTLLSSALDTGGDPDKATGIGANTLVASR
jgi:hypothetical protein